jgi:hypothetical protein
MSKLMPLTDFRARRRVLTADDFALGGDDVPPQDLIDRKTWEGLTTLPTDVSIRTSDHNGTRLRILYSLGSHWLEAMGPPGEEGFPPGDMIFVPMLDASDELTAATFNALHGFYRPSIGCARNALELATVGCACQTLKLDSRYKAWRDGTSEFGFGSACNLLIGAPRLKDLRTALAATLGDSLFDHRTQQSDGGWIRRLYAKLSDYAHSPPDYTSGDLWSSNGPVYVTEAFHLFFYMHIETFAACLILTKIAKPDLRIDPTLNDLLFRNPSGTWVKIATEAAKQLGLLT